MAAEQGGHIIHLIYALQAGVQDTRNVVKC